MFQSANSGTYFRRAKQSRWNSGLRECAIIVAMEALMDGRYTVSFMCSWERVPQYLN